MKKQHLNRGRNVINIEAIKEYLHTYAKERNLSLAVSSWLQKSFTRWLINYFPEVQKVESIERYEQLMQQKPPTWFKPKNGLEFIYIYIQNPTFFDILNTCVEFLSSRSQKVVHKFPRMTVEHIMQKSQEEHQRMLKRRERYIETSKEALEIVFRFKNLHVVKLLPHHKELSLEMARESALMQHCLGEFEDVENAQGGYGSYYFGRIQNQEITLYSLRDEKNMPHATISVSYKRGEAWLDQIKGKQNRAPIAKYVPACVAFFNHLKVKHHYHQDALAMGVVYVKGRSEALCNIKDESTQQQLIAYDPSFIKQLPNPSKSSLWLAALRNPKEMGGLKESSNAMKIAALLQHPLLLNELKFSNGLTGKNILQQQEVYTIAKRTFLFPKLEVTRI